MLKFVNENINRAYLGNNEVNAIYLGGYKLFGSNSSPIIISISFDYTTETNYGTKQNNESYRPLELNVYNDGVLITSGYLPLSVEVEKGSTVTIGAINTVPDSAEIYTSDDISGDEYTSCSDFQENYNFSYVATDSASFYIDSTGRNPL